MLPLLIDSFSSSHPRNKIDYHTYSQWNNAAYQMLYYQWATGWVVYLSRLVPSFEGSSARSVHATDLSPDAFGHR